MITCELEATQIALTTTSEELGDSFHFGGSENAPTESSQHLQSNGFTAVDAPPVFKEDPRVLAQRLLTEFGKTRTNYSSLVPRVIEVMRIYRDYGPHYCPIPVITNLDALLNDEALIDIENRYPGCIEAGFLVLVTEKRALRSGGGGKYYFMDGEKLVGCHKGDLKKYAEKGAINLGPVLLKNLIFVFILRSAIGLDPRCKSSNPQRLLEFYEGLAKQGRVSDIQRLLRVWSMEVHCEAPYDQGFPHCTLLWVKRMNVQAHVQKWKASQYQASQNRAQRELNDITGAFEIFVDYNSRLRRPKRRRASEDYTPQTSPIGSESWPEKYEELSWDPDSVAALYEHFSHIGALLTFHDIVDWSVVILNRLNDTVLNAAMQLISSTFLTTTAMSRLNETATENVAIRCEILQMICEVQEKDRMAEALRILLACLVQQQRLETLPVDADVEHLLQNDSITAVQSIITQGHSEESLTEEHHDTKRPCTENSDVSDVLHPFENIFHPQNHLWDNTQISDNNLQMGGGLNVESDVLQSNTNGLDNYYTCEYLTTTLMNSSLSPCWYSSQVEATSQGVDVVLGQPTPDEATLCDEICEEVDVQESNHNELIGNQSEPTTAPSTPFRGIEFVDETINIKPEHD